MFSITHSLGVGTADKRRRCLRMIAFSCFLLFASALCRAEIDCIQFTLPDGVTETILLSSRPKVRMDSSLISIVYDESELSIPLEHGLKVRLLDSQLTNVKTTTCQAASFTVTESGIACHGLPEKATVSLFDAAGAVVRSVIADEQGNAFIPLPEVGQYVIASGNNSFKFYIK